MFSPGIQEVRVRPLAPKSWHTNTESVEHKLSAPALIGSVGHSAADNVITHPNGYKHKFTERYSDKPRIFRGWADKVASIVPRIITEMQPEVGYEGALLTEVRFFMGKNATKAAIVIRELLEGEQKEFTDQPGPFEQTILACPYWKDPRVRGNQDFKTAVADLTSGSFEYTAREVKQMFHEARGMTFALGDRLVMGPSVRADWITTRHETGNTDAAKIAKAYRRLLKTHKVGNMNFLHRASIPYGEGINQEMLSGLEVSERMLNAMLDGEIDLGVYDTKFIPHLLGDNVEIDQIWADHGNDIGNIFTDQNLLYGVGPQADRIRSMWNPWEADVAKTEKAVASFAIRAAIRETGNRKLARGHEDICRHLGSGILLIDFDCRADPSRWKSNAARLAHQPRLDYEVIPGLETLRVPRVANVLRRDTPDKNTMELLAEEWAQAVYDQPPIELQDTHSNEDLAA